uniref:Tetraspanin n=1 Tax=Sinocyclocheilus grahami TaxID=75366 RepID=A0A672N794_SINGR
MSTSDISVMGAHGGSWLAFFQEQLPYATSVTLMYIKQIQSNALNAFSVLPIRDVSLDESAFQNSRNVIACTLFVFLQWECCGAFGADDWNLNVYFNCTDSNPSREKCGVPFSCCTKDPAEDVINTQCGYDVRAKSVKQKTYIHVKGCVPQFEKWLQDNLTVVAGIFIGVALLQIFGICLAQNLISDIEAVRASW